MPEAKFVDKMKIALQNLKKDIIQSLIAENEDFKSIVDDMDPKDLVDIAADDIDRKTLEAIGVQEIKRMNLIDGALSRIENGVYGKCVKCGEPIPKARLEAIPYAHMCINCKSSDERRRR